MSSTPPRGVGRPSRRLPRLTGAGTALLLTAAFVSTASTVSTAHATVGATLYVGAVGGSGCSDSASGAGSQSLPFCTIGGALSGITAGTTVLVNPGTYTETVAVGASGTSGAPITVQAVSPGTATVTGGTHGFVVSGQHYVTIAGFTVTGTSAEGISVVNADHVVVTGNTVSYSGHQVSGQNAVGIKLSGVTASQVTGNRSDHNSFHGIHLDTGTTGVTVSGNEASFNAEGWQRNANGIDVISTGNTIIGNTLHDNEDSGLQFYPGGDHNLAASNVLYGNGDHGVDDLNVTGNTLVGNTVYNNCTDGINVEGTSSDYIVENNISMDNAVNTACAHGPAGQDGRGRAGEIGIYDTATTGTTVDHNLVYSSSGTDQLYEWGAVGYTSLSAFRAGSGQGAHDLVGNPGFADIAAADFHVTAGSPAVDSADSGVAGWPGTDADGKARVDDPSTPDTGTGPRTFDDRGAYEFQVASQPVLTARLALQPASGTAPVTVTADASGSTAGTSPISTYSFDFGDGSPVQSGAAATATYTYMKAGSYTLTLTVKDASGLSATAVGTVSVSPQATSISYAGRPASEAVVATNTGSTVPVTSATHAGNALIVSVYLTGATAGPVTATDTKHNGYSVVSDVTDSTKHRTLILATFATNALTTSDSISLTWPGASKHNITVDEFAGLQQTDQQTTASGPAGGTVFATPALTTAGSSELLFAAVGTNSGTAPTFDAGWTSLAPLALSSYKVSSAYTIVGPGTYTASGTTTAQWAASLAAFK